MCALGPKYTSERSRSEHGSRDNENAFHRNLHFVVSPGVRHGGRCASPNGHDRFPSMPDIDPSMTRDEAWFRSIHSRTGEAVSRYALRRAPTRADAEDVVAETYLVAWRRRDAVPEPPEDLLWLYGVTRNTLANVARSARRRERLWSRLASEPVQTESALDDVRSLAIRAAVDTLPALDAELLRLLAWEGLSHREIAAVLGSTENAIALRASRARRKLEAALTTQATRRT
jgi:RNA polymerase sigma-70 factor (ECF subfamily)